jgi:hypothetical protein
MRAYAAVMSLAIGCTGMGEEPQVHGGAFEDITIDQRRPDEVAVPLPPPSPPDEVPELNRFEKVIALDAGDAPGFWNDTWSDRLPLELRLRPFGDEVHVELRNTGRDRVYWGGYLPTPNSVFMYAEPPGGEPILQSPCWYTPEWTEYDPAAWLASYSLAPGETLPLATIHLTRTTPEWVVAWKEDTAWCIVLPVGTELRVGFIASSENSTGRMRFPFHPLRADGFPSRTHPRHIHAIEPPTEKQFLALPKVADRRSNGVILHPAEKPFEGRALRRTKPSTASRVDRGDAHLWRPGHPVHH